MNVEKDYHLYKIIQLAAVLAIFCCHNILLAQNKVIDSLNTQLAASKSDTSKILILIEISYQFRGVNPDSCIKIAERAHHFSEQNNFTVGKAWALNRMAIGYSVKSDYKKATSLFLESLVVFEEIKEKRGIISCLNNLGNVHEMLGNYDIALDYHFKSLHLKEEINDLRGLASSYNNIGNIFLSRDDYITALDYFLKSIQIKEDLKDQIGKASSLNNVGLIYQELSNHTMALDYFKECLKIYESFKNYQGVATSLVNIGNCYRAQGELELALDYMSRSLKIYEGLKDKKGIALGLNNLGYLYQAQGQYALSNEYYTQSLKIRVEIKDKKGIILSLLKIAKIFQILHVVQQSNYYAEKALVIAEEIKANDEIKEANYILANNYYSNQDYALALKYFERYNTISDSIFGIEKNKEILKLQSQLEIKKKDNEIKILRVEKELSHILSENQDRKLKIILKQAETNNLLSLARQESDLKKADSLKNLAEKSQLQLENLQIADEKILTENKAKSVEILKGEERAKLQNYIMILIMVLSVAVGIFGFWVYIISQKEKRSKKVLLQKNAEISLLNNNLDAMVQSRTKDLEYKNQKLEEYVLFCTHKLNIPTSRILGLYQLLKMNPSTEEKNFISEKILENTIILDTMVIESQERLNPRED